MTAMDAEQAQFDGVLSPIFGLDRELSAHALLRIFRRALPRARQAALEPPPPPTGLSHLSRAATRAALRPLCSQPSCRISPPSPGNRRAPYRTRLLSPRARMLSPRRWPSTSVSSRHQ